MEKKITKSCVKTDLVIMGIAIIIMAMFVGFMSFNGDVIIEKLNGKVAMEQTMEVSSSPVYNANGSKIGDADKNPASNNDPEAYYDTLRERFYNVFNTYVLPTALALATAVLAVSMISLGIARAKEQDEAKIQVLNKRMIQWGIGAMLIFLSVPITMGIAELVMGIQGGWGM